MNVAVAEVSEETDTVSARTPPKLTAPLKPEVKKLVPVKVKVLASVMTTLEALGIEELVSKEQAPTLPEHDEPTPFCFTLMSCVVMTPGLVWQRT